MRGGDEVPEWHDNVVELHPRVFILDVTEDEPPDDPGPPGGSRSPPPESLHSVQIPMLALN